MTLLNYASGLEVGGKILILCLTPHLPSCLEFPAEGNKHRIISIIFIKSWTNLKYLMTSKFRTPLVNSDWVQAWLQRLTELSYFLQISLILGLWSGPIAPPANQLHSALTQTPEHCLKFHPHHEQGRQDGLLCIARKEGVELSLQTQALPRLTTGRETSPKMTQGPMNDSLGQSSDQLLLTWEELIRTMVG